MPYQAHLATSFLGAFLSYTHDGTTINFEAPTSAANVTAVTRTLTSGPIQGDVVTYPDALGAGIDVMVSLTLTAMRKEIVLQTKDALGTLTGDSYDLPAFKLTSNKDVTLSVDGTTLTEGTPLISQKGVTFLENGIPVAYVWAPYAHDAGKGGANIDLVFTKTKDGIYLQKRIPTAWLQSAAYPVRTDATVSYTPASGDGLVNKTDGPFSTVHDASTGNTADATTGYNDLYVTHQYTNAWYISRIFLPFNTASLPDDAIVTQANLHVHMNYIRDDANDGKDYMTVVQTHQASTSTL